MNDHSHIERVLAESKSAEEGSTAEKIMVQMEFIGTKITEVSW